MQHRTGFWMWEEKTKEKRQKGTPLKIYNVRIHALPFKIVSCKTELKRTSVAKKLISRLEKLLQYWLHTAETLWKGPSIEWIHFDHENQTFATGSQLWDF